MMKCEMWVFFLFYWFIEGWALFTCFNSNILVILIVINNYLHKLAIYLKSKYIITWGIRINKINPFVYRNTSLVSHYNIIMTLILNKFLCILFMIFLAIFCNNLIFINYDISMSSSEFIIMTNSKHLALFGR